MLSPLGFWKSSGEIWTRSEIVVRINIEIFLTQYSLVIRTVRFACEIDRARLNAQCSRECRSFSDIEDAPGAPRASQQRTAEQHSHCVCLLTASNLP